MYNTLRKIMQIGADMNGIQTASQDGVRDSEWVNAVGTAGFQIPS